MESSATSARKLFATTPANRPHQADLFWNAGLEYCNVFRKTKSKKDLKKALRSFEDGLALTPANHPHRTARVWYLGLVYYSRYRAAADRVVTDQTWYRGIEFNHDRGA